MKMAARNYSPQMRAALFYARKRRLARMNAGGTPPASIQPIPRMIEAPNIIILGASHAAAGFNQIALPPIQRLITSAGFSGTISSFAVAGDGWAGGASQLSKARETPSIAATRGNNVYIIDLGGNDISQIIKGIGTLEQLEVTIRTVLDQIVADGDMFVWSEQSKRLSPWADIPPDADIDEVGMKHYNETFFNPLMQEYIPEWFDDSGKPYVSMYDLADKFPGYLSADGNHGYGLSGGDSVYGKWKIGRFLARARGFAPRLARIGKSYLYQFSGQSNSGTVWKPFNFLTVSSVVTNPPLLLGAIDTDGEYDSEILVRQTAAFSSGLVPTGGDGAGAFPRIADTRFHNADLLSLTGLIVQTTGKAVVEFCNLTPGEVVQITCVGSRSGTGTTRRGRIDLMIDGVVSQSLVLDAAASSPSNQIVFNPVVVPDSGVISISNRVEQGSSFGYLVGIALDFQQSS